MSQPGPQVSPTMHGIFFEDINYAADGGLYAELVQNRSFEHRDKLFSWKPVQRGSVGEVKIASEPSDHLGAGMDLESLVDVADVRFDGVGRHGQLVGGFLAGVALHQ